MYPYINVLGKDLGTYMIMATTGLLVASAFCIRQAKKRKLDDNDFILILIAFAIGLVIGGHLLFSITNIPKIAILIKNIDKIDTFKKVLACLAIVFGGSVFYGGLIGGFTSAMLYCKKKKFKFNDFKDIIATSIPLFHGFGRIGCFLGGCCFGVESHWGFISTDSIIEEANHVRRFPIQLVESLFCFILFFVLYKFFFNKEKYKGKVLYIYFVTYPVARFIIEFFRGDEYRGFIHGLSTSQIISIVLFVYGLIKLITINKKLKKKQ